MNRICDLCKADLGNQTDTNFNLHRDSKQCKAKQKTLINIGNLYMLLKFFIGNFKITKNRWGVGLFFFFLTFGNFMVVVY